MINGLPVSKVGEYTVAGLILNELQLTNRFWNLYKYMTRNHKTVSEETLHEFIATIEHVTITKIDQLKTMFNDSDFLNSISYDVANIKSFINSPTVTNKLKDDTLNHIVTRDWPRMRIDKLHTELTCKETLNEINKLAMQNVSGQGVYPQIVKLKAKIEVDILRMLAYAIRIDMSIIPKIKKILSKYVLYFNPQRLAQSGICACLSIKFIRNILLENLRNNNDFATLCKAANETYKSKFDLAIKDEADLIFVYVMLMQKEINSNINLQEVLYFIFEAISRNDYQSISSLYVLSTAIEKEKAKQSDAYKHITVDTIVSLVEDARKVFLSYDIKDDEFEHLSFNCLRTLIFEDQKLDERESDYQYFFSYILFDHNMNEVRTEINKAGTEYNYSAESSSYYKNTSDCMSRLLTVHPYFELESDFVDKLIKNACSDVENAVKVAETPENIAKAEKIYKTTVNDVRNTFDYMGMHSGAVHKLATILDHTYKTTEDTLEKCYVPHDDVSRIVSRCSEYKKKLNKYKQSVFQLYMPFACFGAADDPSYGVAVGEVYIAMLNHIWLHKVLPNISPDIHVPYFMEMYPDPAYAFIGHAYVKYVYDGDVVILDPNFSISDAKNDASITDISIVEDDPFKLNVDSAYNHVMKSVAFYGGHDRTAWLYCAVPFLAIAIIAAIIFAVVSYFSNNDEKNNPILSSFWYNQ